MPTTERSEMTTKEIVNRPQQDIVPQSFNEMLKFAEAFVKSGYFADIRGVAQGIVKIQAGKELGFPPVYSMQKIFFVKGKLTMAAEAMGAKIKASGDWDYYPLEWTNEKCHLVFKELKTGKEFPSIFTIQDARQAELVKPDSGWLKWPRAMLWSKALSQGARAYCPHLIGGAYTPEDLDFPTDDDGQPIIDSDQLLKEPAQEVPHQAPAPAQATTTAREQPEPPPASKEPQKTKPKVGVYPEGWKPANIGEMLKWAWEVKAVSRDMALEALGKKDTTEITDLSQAWDKVQKMKEFKG